MLCNVSILAVLVASIVAMALGAYWYSPAGFGKQWMALMGITPEKAAAAKVKGMNKEFAINFLVLLVTNFILARAIFMVGSNTWFQGAVLAFWIWVGFFAAPMIGGVIWEGRSWKHYGITAGYYLVSLLISGMILAAW